MNPYYRALSLWNVTTGAARDIRGVRPVWWAAGAEVIAAGYGFAAGSKPDVPWGVRFFVGMVLGVLLVAVISVVVSVWRAEP